MRKMSSWRFGRIHDRRPTKAIEVHGLKIFKVHLTPKFFFAKIIKLFLWSNLAQDFFDLVKSSSFYAPSKYVQMPPFWFATEFNGA